MAGPTPSQVGLGRERRASTLDHGPPVAEPGETAQPGPELSRLYQQ